MQRRWVKTPYVYMGIRTPVKGDWESPDRGGRDIVKDFCFLTEVEKLGSMKEEKLKEC